MESGEINYNKCDADTYGYQPTGIVFNDAYRYIDWLLTVPMLLIEIILVMGLDPAETQSRCITLGVSAALMIAFGYPGEVSADPSTRWMFLVYLHDSFLLHRVHSVRWTSRRTREANPRGQGPRQMGLLGHCHLVVHLPNCVHPSYVDWLK